MSIQDPVADMLVRIKNAQAVAKPVVNVQNSKLKVAIANVLHDEGYIDGFSIDAGNMIIALKYCDGKPVIGRLERVSRPSLRIYQPKDKLPEVENGLGIAIVSTSKGVMTATKAK